MAKQKKIKKTEMIHLRVSEEEKRNIQVRAARVGMSVSSFLLLDAQNKDIVAMENAQTAINELYKIHLLLDKYEAYTDIPVQKVRDELTMLVGNCILESKEEK